MATITWFLLIGAVTSCFYKGIGAKHLLKLQSHKMETLSHSSKIFIHGSQNSRGCGEWRRFGDSCYLFSNINRNWTHAQENCIDQGGYLIELGSLEEFTFMRNTLREIAPKSCHDIKWYLGASDVAQEGKYIWMHSKTDVGSFLLWQNGEQNNLEGDEDCMAVNSNYDYLVYDLFCQKYGQKVFSICEKPAV